jgi:hypothetical protein
MRWVLLIAVAAISWAAGAQAGWWPWGQSKEWLWPWTKSQEHDFKACQLEILKYRAEDRDEAIVLCMELKGYERTHDLECYERDIRALCVGC